MALAGDLGDIGLEELLQFIGLSGKSGRLTLRYRDVTAQALITEGRIRGIVRCGKDRGDGDLGALAAAAGLLPMQRYYALRRYRAECGGTWVEVLVTSGGVSAHALERLRREAIEAAILDLFDRREGDFHFAIGAWTATPQEAERLLERGLNAEYLALEGVRRRDEKRHSGQARGARFPGVEPPPAPLVASRVKDGKHPAAVTGSAVAPHNGSLGAGRVG